MYSRETGRDWDKELADDVKGECEEKYGTVEAIKVEKESQVGFSVFRLITSGLTYPLGRDIYEVQNHRLRQGSHPRP
jgi:hypothetical protein